MVGVPLHATGSQKQLQPGLTISSRHNAILVLISACMVMRIDENLQGKEE